MAHRGGGHCPSGPVRLAEFIKNFLVKLKIESESLFRRTPDWERGATAIINHKALQPPRKLRCCWLSGLQEPVLSAAYVTDGWVSPVIEPACGREIVAGRVEGARLADTKQQRADGYRNLIYFDIYMFRFVWRTKKYLIHLCIKEWSHVMNILLLKGTGYYWYFDNAKKQKTNDK